MKRQANFEILRTVSMLMIVCFHFFTYALKFVSNPAVSEFGGEANYPVLQYIAILSSLGVNLFVLISSYFLVDKPFKLYRLIKTWWQVVFTYMAILGIYSLSCHELISNDMILQGLLPIHENTYWFVTCYIGLLLLVPFLSHFVKSLSKRQHQWLLLVLMVVFTNFSFGYPFGESMITNNGFSLVWFCVLFVYGAYVKIYGFSFETKIKIWHILVAGFIVFAIMSGKLYVKHMIWGNEMVYLMPTYNSLIFILSLMVFVWFRNHQFDETNLFSRFCIICAPYTFGVYLIHDHPILKKVIWNSFNWADLIENYSVFGVIILSVCSIFIICILCDFVREVIFKVIRINDMIYYFSDRIEQKVIRNS